VQGPYPSPPGQLCNVSAAVVTAYKPAEWYAKDPATWQTDVCVPVLNVSKLRVLKTIDNSTPGTPPATAFLVDVDCTLNGAPFGPHTTLTFTYPPNPLPHVFQAVPVGSLCRIVEQPLVPTLIALSDCNSGFATWGSVIYPNPVGPDSTPQSVIITTNTNHLEVNNTLACVPSGSLTVSKAFDPGTSTWTPPVGAVFPVQVACSPGTTTIVNLTNANLFQLTVGNFPIGSGCTITELPPQGAALPPNCDWDTVTYPVGQSATISQAGGVLKVLNTVVCTSKLAVRKTFAPGSIASILPLGAVFPVQVACSPGTTTIVNLTNANLFQLTVGNFPIGTGCTITELPPQGASLPPNCDWDTVTYPGGQSAIVSQGGALLNVLNTVVCGEAATGTLTVTKAVFVDNGTVDFSMVNFQITVACSPALVETFALSSSTTMSHTVHNIPLLSQCTITEAPPAPLPFFASSGCAWVSNTPIQVTILAVSQNVEARNVERCGPLPPAGTANLGIDKRSVVDGVLNFLGMSFQVQLTCTPTSGAVFVLNLTLGQSTNYSLNGTMPLGTTCSVAETTPAVPLLFASRNCTWNTTYFYDVYGNFGPPQPGNSVTLDDHLLYYGLRVRNELVCLLP
jgi:hypothetical protein